MNLFVLDRSGSMESKVEDVKGGLKSALTDIKNDAIRDIPIATVSTIVTEFSSFNDFEVTVNTSNSTTLDPAVADKFKTVGSTALYDAIHKSFALVPDGQDGVFVTIFTDGGENDSREIRHADVKKLIEKKKEQGWVITFMGTTEADISTAVSFGISRGNTMSFSNDGAGVSKSLNKMSSMRHTYYMANTDMNFMETASIDMNNLVAEDDKLKDITEALSKAKKTKSEDLSKSKPEDNES